MSIFPCVKPEEGDANFQEHPQNQNEVAKNWLQNASFKADLVESCSFDGIQQSGAGDNSQSDAGGNSQSDHVKDRHSFESSPPDKHTDGDQLTSKHVSDDKYKSNKRKHKKHKKSSSSKSRKRKTEKQERLRGDTPPRVPPPRKIFIEEMRDLGYADAYRLDRSRDKDNYAYGCMNKKHLSRYKPISKVPCGLTRKQTLLWRKKEGKSWHPERYYSKTVRQSAYKPGTAVKPNTDKEPTESLHIPLPSSSAPGSQSQDNPLGILDEATLLWSQGKAPADTQIEGNGTPSYLTSTVSQKITTYNRELRERPDDITLWMKLINVQDGLLEQRTDDDSSKLFTQQLIHDKKLAIIAQALKHNPSNLQLKLKELELNGKTLDWTDMNEQWKKLTFSHVNDVQVWKGYLQHVRSSFSKFTVGVMVKAYTKCVKSLRQVSQGLLKSHACQPNTVQHMIDTLLELCELLHLANCTEKAVAIAQAMIEFNMHQPSTLASHEECIQSFQEYYDSGVPRFGEPGGKGWSNASNSQYTIMPAPLKPTVTQDEVEEDKLLAQCQSLSRAESWLLLERSRQMSHWLPWRPAADEKDEDCEDPHRLVLSDDFIDLLFYIEDEPLRAKAYLQLLGWLGLRSVHSGCTHPHIISGVNHLHKVMTSLDGCLTLSWHDYLLNDLFIAHCTEQAMAQLTGQDKCLLVIQRLYYQLDQVLATSDKKERKRKGKEFKNYAKSILSLEENRSNQKLWLTFADCNRRLGLYAEMQQVYSALMSSEQPTTDGSSTLTISRCELWWQVVMGALAQDKSCMDELLSLSCWLVCRGSPSAVPSASQKLLLVRELEEAIQSLWEKVGSSCSEKTCTAAVFSHLLICYYIILVLLRGLSSLRQALYHWTPQLVRIFHSDKVTLSAYYTMVVCVLKYTHQHLYQSCTPLLRSFLQTALNDFPESTDLLIDYLSVEQSTHVVTRVRQFFTSRLSVDDGEGAGTKELLAVYSVLFELAQLEKMYSTDESDRGINHRIRSLCARCLTALCPGSVLLWRLYLYHEAKYGRRQKVESIFYAAVQACPYAKPLYTDAIIYMPDLLAKILEIAEDKEVRIHTPLEELHILLHQE